MSGCVSLREALAEARRIGCLVEPVRRTGEMRVIAPSGARVVVNNRRKDASRALLLVIRRARQTQGAR